jgi:peptidoglycan hydrolase-like protein with peptidoglycan-binding domain
MNSATTTNDPVLKLGSQGPKVRELQQLLNRRLNVGNKVPTDGVFGRETETGLKIIQYQFLIKQTGIADAITWKSIRANAAVDKPVLRRGSTGEQVLRVQEVLSNAKYYAGAFDSNFGVRMDTSVKAFQKDRQLLADGIIGLRGWKALSDLATLLSE